MTFRSRAIWEISVAASKFTRRWLIALSGLVLLGIALPFMIAPLAYATGCQRAGGACGAVAFILVIFLRLPIVIGVGLYVAVLAWKRSATLRLKPWGFLFVVISYLAASSLLFGVGNIRVTDFAIAGSLAGTLPAFCFLLAGLVGLSLLPNSVAGGSRTAARSTTFATGGLSMLLLLPGAISALTIVPFVNWIAFPINLVVMRLTAPFLLRAEPFLTFSILLAFVFSLAWWIKSDKADRAGIA